MEFFCKIFWDSVAFS